MLVQALSDPSAQVRAEAARSLGRHGDAQAVPSLILALSDAEPRVRAQAAAALECIRVEDARAPLLELLEDEDKDVRTRAALALGALGAPDAIPQLIEIVQFAYWQHRPSAATYLCQMKAEEPLPVLTRALGEHEKGLNRTVARGLGILGSRNAVPEMIRYLGYGGDRKYRIALIEALGELGDRSAVPASSDALHRWGDSAAVPVLLQLGGREAEDAVIRQVNEGTIYERSQVLSGGWARPASPGPCRPSGKRWRKPTPCTWSAAQARPWPCWETPSADPTWWSGSATRTKTNAGGLPSPWPTWETPAR